MIRLKQHLGSAFVSSAVLVFLMGCMGDSERSSKETPSEQKLLLKSVASESEFVSEVKSYYQSVLEQPKIYYDEMHDMETLSDASFASTESSNPEVSSTNLVEKGVDEADVVKSDGKYLYIVKQGEHHYSYIDDVCNGVLCASVVPERYSKVRSNPSVRVMSLTNSAEPSAEEVANIVISKVSYIRGIYLVNDNQQVVVVGEGKKFKTQGLAYSSSTYVASYDVSDIDNIEKIWEFEVEGWHKATRSMNDKLYLMSTNNFWIDGIELSSNGTARESSLALIEALTIDDILPQAWLNDEVFTAVEATDCINPDKINEQSIFNANLLSIFTIPLETPDSMNALCTLETSSEVYVSQNAIYTSKGEYVYKPESKTYTYSTVIHKLAFTDDNVEYRASARLPGTTGWRSSDFRMSEKDGYLRVMTSRYEQAVIGDGTNIMIWPGLRDLSHHLYVLEENDETNTLEEVSTLPNDEYPQAIGKPGEDVYAVRYFGDYAYVVTYLNIDPLYAINLSNHENPFIEGELELPGYSDYLHPLSDNMLLGVGKETIVKDDVAWMQGVKVGLFDVTDKSSPLLIGDYEIGKRGSDTAVSYDYHAFSVLSNAETGMHKLSIPVRVHERKINHSFLEEHMQWHLWSRSGTQLFEVDDGSVSTFPSLEHSGELVSHEYSGENIYYYANNPRTVIVEGESTSVGDALHFISDGEVWSAKWDEPENAQGPQ